MNIEISDWAWIPMSEYPENALHSLKKALTVVPRRTSIHQTEIVPIKLFRLKDGMIGIPRAFFYKNSKRQHEITDNMSRGHYRDIKFAGELRDDQVQAFETVVAGVRDGSVGGIVKAAPGYGKTVLAIKIWTQFACTALVVVQKEFLVNQWQKRIEQFAPNARVGIIRQDKCEIGGDFDISIAMIQSLAKRKDDYPKELWSWPGLVIHDEIHHIGSLVWSDIAPIFSGYYRLGISASPKRKDGADNVFLHHIGEVVYTSKVRKMVPKLRRIFTGFKLHATPRFDPNKASKEIQLRFLCGNVARNVQIIAELNKAVRAGRKVIVLSERLKHLEILNEMFKASKPNDCIADFYIGGRSMADLETAEKANVIFGTYAMAKEALDIPSLDTIFLVTPVADVEQPVGRIMREYSDKKEPIVVDFVDNDVKRFKQLFNSRMWFYKKNGMFDKEI